MKGSDGDDELEIEGKPEILIMEDKLAVVE